MPVDNNSMKKAMKCFFPAFIFYSLLIAIFLYFFNENPYAGIIIYISIFLFGGFISYVNEKRLVPNLMQIEKDAYYKSFAKKIMSGESTNDIFSIGTYNNIDYFKTQYDYYIRKTLLTQRLGSLFLFMLMGGILLDITLNSVDNHENIFRTILVLGIVALFSTLFLMVAILKHAEYNAGCAVYRNAILAMDISRTMFSQKTFRKSDLARAIGWALQNLRLKCDETCELQEEFLNDGWKTLELLELIGSIVPNLSDVNVNKCVSNVSSNKDETSAATSISK